MKCYMCGKNIKSAGNRKRLRGHVNVWVHKLCPGVRNYQYMKKQGENKP